MPFPPVDIPHLIRGIDTDLRAAGTAARAAGARAYLKSDLEHYGTSVPDVRRVATSLHRHHRDLDHAQLVALVEGLWDAPVYERRLVCVELLACYRASLRTGDVGMLERLLRESRTWALVDPLATAVVAPLVERGPDVVGTLDRWAADDDFWLRRAALLALLPALRRGEGNWDRFTRYADAMLEEREFFVRKAIGWVLRDTGRRRPDLVYEWILARAKRASGVTLREAVKPLSARQRAAVLAAR